MPKYEKQPICLTIAGLDPSGGAGIVADIKTFSRFGCFSAAAVTSVTFQNTLGVFGSLHQSAESVCKQIAAVFDDYEIASLKTGMLPTREIVEAVADIIRKRDVKSVVVDPVVRSTSGFDLIDEPALEALVEKLFPLADIVTPNLPEAERITKCEISSEDDIAQAAAAMQAFGARNVLIKGGHNPKPEQRNQNVDRKAVDHLFLGLEKTIIEADFIDTTATHGTGCVLSSAIAANLALGHDIVQSVKVAKDFVTEAIRTAPKIGHGHSPINI